MKIKKISNGSKLALVMILSIVIFFIGMGIATYRETRDIDNMKEKRCKTYCNCSISNDCYYAFDYNDVKNCDCGE